MPNSYYSPNTKLTGGALFASFNSKDASVYFKVLKQIANNPDKKGNFDGQNPVNVKLSQDEIADIIRAIRTNTSSSFYHKFKDGVTTGKFTYYSLDATDRENKPIKRTGFGLTIRRDDVEIKVGFTLGSAERLSLFLQNALVHIFDAEYSEDIKRAKEYANKAKPAQNEEYIPSETSEEPVQTPSF